MLMLNKKNAYVLLEVLFAVFIFCSMMLMIIKLELSSIKCSDMEEDYKKYTVFCEAFYNEILYNVNEEDMNSHKSLDYYIDDENIDLNKIRNLGAFGLLSMNKGNSSYIKIRINGEEVYDINLSIHYIKYGKEEIIEKNFKKGKY